MKLPSTSQKDDGLLVDLFFCENYPDDPAADHTPSATAESLAKSGKTFGYFVSNEQANFFLRELDWLIAHDYILFDVSEMQAVTAQSTAQHDAVVGASFTAINLTCFVDEHGAMDTTALACALHVLMLANDIFIEGLPASSSLIARRPVSITCQGLWDTARALLSLDAVDTEDMLQSEAAAIGAYVLSCIHLSSVRIARQTGPYRNYGEDAQEVLASLQSNRRSVAALGISTVSEELLNAIAGTWDEVLDECSKYGIRSAAISLLAVPAVVTVSDLRSGASEDVLGSANSSIPADTSYQRSRTYSVQLEDEAVVQFVASESAEGALTLLHILSNTHGLLDELAHSVSIGLQNGVPLKEYAAEMAMTDVSWISSGGVITQELLVGYILRRLALDYMPSQSLAELGISGKSSQQMTLLPLESLEGELELSDIICTDCGSNVSIVGAYFICLECGSAGE